MQKRLLKLLAISILCIGFVFSGCKVNSFEYLPDYDIAEGTASPFTNIFSPAGIPAVHASNFTASMDEVGKIVLTWDHIINASKYNVYRSAVASEEIADWKLIGETSTFSSIGVVYEDVLEPGAIYYYRITVVDINGIEGPMTPLLMSASGESSAGKMKGEILSFTVTAGTGGQTISAEWQGLEDVEYYKIYRAQQFEDDTHGTMIVAGTVLHDSDLALQLFTDNKQYSEELSIKPGVMYRYWVVGVNSDGAQTDFSDDVNVGFIFPAPIDVVASMGTVADGIDIQWEYDPVFKNSKTATFVTYKVYSSALPGGEVSFFTTGDIVTPSYSYTIGTDTSNPVANYPFDRFFRITAIFNVGGTTVETRKSDDAKGVIVDSNSLTPASDFDMTLAVSPITNAGAFELSWPAVPSTSLSPVSYDVYRSSSENGFYSKRSSLLLADEDIDGRYYFKEYSYDDSLKSIEKSIDVSTEYWYRIVCIADNGVQGGYSSALGGYVPSPAGLIDGSATNEAITISWAASDEPNLQNYALNKSYTDAGGTESSDIIVLSDTTVQYVDSDIFPGWSYSYAIHAIGPEYLGNKTYSQALNSYDVKIYPFPVINNAVAMQSVVGGGVTLSWDLLDDALSYKVYRTSTLNEPIGASAVGGNLLFISGAEEVSYLDVAAVIGENYFYWVSALYVDGESVFSPAIAGNLLGITQELFVSPSFDGSGTYDNSVMVNWEAVDGASSYLVDYSIGGAVQTPISTTNLNTAIAAVGTVELSITVKAVNAADESAPASEVVLYTYNNETSSPLSLTASNGEFSAAVNLSWSAPAGVGVVATYVIYRDNVAIHTTADNGTSWIDTTILPEDRNTSYFYSVSAVNISAVESAKSQPAEGYLLSSPQNVQASQGSYRDYIEVSFDKIDSADDYGFALSETPEVPIVGVTASFDLDGRVGFNIPLTVDQIGTIVSIIPYSLDAASGKAVADAVTGYVLAPIVDCVASQGDFPNKVQLVWSAVERADWYRIWYTTNASPLGDADWTKVTVNLVGQEIDGKIVFTYDHASAAVGVPVYYKVQAGAGAGGEGAIDPVSEDNRAVGFIMTQPILLPFTQNGVQTDAGITDPEDRGTDSTEVTLNWESGLSAITVDGGTLELVVEATSQNGVDCNPDSAALPLAGSLTFAGYEASGSAAVPVGTPIDYVVYMKRTTVDGTVVNGPSVEVSLAPIFNPPIITQALSVDGTALDGEGVTDTAIQVKWNEILADYLNGYLVYRSRDKNNLSSYSAITTSISGSAGIMSCDDTGEINATDAPEGRPGAYFYRIKVQNSVGALSAYSDALELYKVPDRINGSLLKGSSKDIIDEIKLQWSHIKGVDKYRVYFEYLGTTRSDSNVAFETTVSVSQSDVEVQFGDLLSSGEDLAAGNYSFWVQPIVSSTEHGGTRVDSDGNVADSQYTFGAIELSNDRWVHEVLDEMRASAAMLGNRSSMGWSIGWQDQHSNWAYGSKPESVPGNLGGRRSTSIIDSNNVKGERVCACWTYVDSPYYGTRFWFNDSSSGGVMTLYGTVWDIAGDSWILGGAAGSSTITTRFVDETSSRKAFGPIKVSGLYDGYLQLGLNGDGSDDGIDTSWHNKESNSTTFSTGSGGTVHILRGADSSQAYNSDFVSAGVNGSSPVYEDNFTEVIFDAAKHWN